MLFDKTGTLTTGRPTLSDVVDLSGLGESILLRFVGAAESPSEHPVARALVEAARQKGALLAAAESFHSEPGGGVEALVEAHRVQVGTRAYLAQFGIDTTSLEGEAERLASMGRTPSFVAIDGRLAGLVAVADRPRPEAKRVVAELRAMGFDVAMLSGDRERVARAIAADVGIERVIAEVRPEAKARVVASERARGRHVVMVGDGSNDAPALAGADVGVAIGSGTDIALAAADIALLRDGIAGLPVALGLARATLRTIRQNLFWAFLYNVVGIPIAAGAFAAWTTWQLSPVLASAAMSLSSVSVITNSLRLRRYGRAT